MVTNKVLDEDENGHIITKDGTILRARKQIKFTGLMKDGIPIVGTIFYQDEKGNQYSDSGKFGSI